MSSRIYPPVRAESDIWDRLEQERERTSQYRQQARPEVAERVASNNGTYPWLPPAANLSLSEAGEGPESPVTDAAARGAAVKREREGWFGKFTHAVARGVDLSGLDSLMKQTGKALDFTVGELGRDAASGLKDVTRPAFLVMDSALDEVKSVIRATVADPDTPGNWFDAYRQVEASPLREVIEDVRAGRRVDIGTGILAGGEVYERKHQAAGALKDPDTGQGYTLGRTVASYVTEPGTTPYNVLSGLADASVDLFADPSSYLFGVGAAKKAATRTFAITERGGIRGVRNTVLPELVDEWLTSREGRRVVEKIAETGDFDTLWRATGKKIPIDTTVRLADASSADEVVDILRPALGVDVREAPRYVHRRAPQPRLAGMMPGSNVPLNDPEEAVEQIDRWLRNAKVGRDRVAEFTDRMARARTRTEKFAVVEDAAEEVATYLTGAWGVKPDKARQLTRIFDSVYEDFRRYAIDEIGENMRFPGVRVDGADRPLPTPHLFVELIEEAIPLPDARDIRRATSRFGPVLNHPTVKAPQAVLDFAQQQVWKRVALLRGAYTIRVIGEEQARMAASGLDSLMSHPLSAIAIASGKKGDLDIAGNALSEADELAGALNKDWAGWVDETRVFTKHKARINTHDPNVDVNDVRNGWAGELVTLHADPVAKQIADAAVSLDDVKARFWAGDLTWVRKEMLAKVPDLADRRLADDYIDSVAERLRIKTGGNPDLLDAIATGRLGDEPLRLTDGSMNRRFAAALEAHTDAMPDYVVVDVMGRAKGATGSDLFRHYDNATNWAFSMLMTKPTNYLSRSPAFKQKYWQRAEELFGFMDDAARQATIDAARAAKMGDVAKRLDRYSVKPPTIAGAGPGLPPLFHGTSARISAPLGNRQSGSGAWNLFGHGFYTTDAEDIARSYTKKGAGGDATVHQVRWTGPNAPRFLDLDEPAPAFVRDFVREAVLDNDSVAPWMDQALRASIHAAVDAPGTSAGDLVQQVRAAAGSSGIKIDEMADLFDELAEQAVSQGFDGLTHMGGGGRYLSNPGDPEHRVRIFLEPEKLEVLDAAGRAGLTLDQADMVAKGWALDETKKLLYDLSDRSQFFDIARYIFPFGEAWKEVLTRWSKIAMERPQTVRRGQQAVTGARGSGFFHTDPNSGEEVFVYRGTGWLTKKLIGVPIPLTGRVAGLSLATEVLPGVGPAVQLSAGWLIPDRPEWDSVREMLFPFGETDTSGGFLEAYLPPWMQKFKRAFADPEQDRLFANTVMDMQQWMVANEEWDTSTPEGIRALMEEAKERAKTLYIVRGAAQFIAPAAPSPRMLAIDPEGRSVAARIIIDDFHAMQAEDYDTATQRFLDKYGPDAFLYTQSKSNTLTYNAPVTKEGLDWARHNPGVVEDFPNVYGFFTPQGGEFDYSVYAQQFETGDRETITPEQAIRLGNNRVAQAIYENAKTQVGPSPSDEQAAWLRRVRGALVEEYPGFQDFTGITQRADTPTLIRELADAVKDPKLAATPQGEAIETYLEARKMAQANAEQAGLASFASATAMRGTRDWLRSIADALTSEVPEFAPSWDLVFSRELADDEAEAG